MIKGIPPVIEEEIKLELLKMIVNVLDKTENPIVIIFPGPKEERKINVN